MSGRPPSTRLRSGTRACPAPLTAPQATMGVLGLVALLALALPSGAGAQGIRIRGSSVVELVQLRPLVPDSIPVASAGDTVSGTNGDLRLGPDGQIVRCTQGAPYCNFRRPASTITAVPVLQDVEASAWGLTRGLRGYAHIRGRASGGDAGIFWPRAEDPVDVLEAYLELDRGALRARAGRQWHSSGLGYYDFDGAALLWRAPRGLSLEGYAGWSLARGLFESRSSGAIEALEPFAPDTRAYLLGVEARWRPGAWLSTQAVYQRELQTNRAGLFSERAGLNARARLARSTLDGQLLYDVAQSAVNEGRLRLQLPTWRRATLALEARHHEPFFELWTIWGAFTPVGFDEARALASWGPAAGRLQLSVGGGPRRYNDPNAGFPGLELRKTGWRFTTDAAWQARDAWTLQAGYTAEVGLGAARSDQNLALRRTLPQEGYAGLTLAAFQTVSEFRVDEGRVLALGGDAGLSLGPAARVDANLYVLRHRDRGNGAPVAPDWSQLRGTVRLTWTLGREPGPRILGPGGAGTPASRGTPAGAPRPPAPAPASTGSPEGRP